MKNNKLIICKKFLLSLFVFFPFFFTFTSNLHAQNQAAFEQPKQQTISLDDFIHEVDLLIDTAKFKEAEETIKEGNWNSKAEEILDLGFWVMFVTRF